jgi:DNA-binding MarR family transcriptional regulator
MDFAVFCAQIRDQQAPKATVTVYLKRLEAAGFVRREIDPSDRRRHRLLLTPPGVEPPRTALRCYRTHSTSVLDASPSRSKRYSRACSNKFSDCLLCVTAWW